MGVIERQTIKGTVFSYLGAGVGFISLVVLSPRIFTTEQIGLTQVLVAISTIIAQLGGLGFGNVTNRLFPYFRTNDGKHTGYLSLAFLVTIIGFIISLIIIKIYMPKFVELNSEKSELLTEYSYLIPVLFGLIMLFNLLDNFCKVLFNAAIGIILREFVLRIVNLVLIILYFFEVIDFNSYVISYVLVFGIPIVIIMLYLISRGEFKFVSWKSVRDKKFMLHMLSLCLFGIISGLSGIALTNIDKYMVNNFIGLGEAGIYSIAVYFASLIVIPARSLGKISVPVIAEAWKRKDMTEIQMVYYKSSINQLAIGLLLFLGIICNLDNIFNILPPEYESGRAVIVLFGVVNLVRVSQGVATNILATSRHYRIQTYTMILLVILVISTNYIFIPNYGLVGAAIASIISIFIISSLTIGILSLKFQLWPFGMNHLLLLGVGLIIYLILSLIPQMNLILDITIRSLLITFLFIFLLGVLKISEEASKAINRIFNLVRKLFFSQHK